MRQHPGSTTALRDGVYLYGANSSRARARGAALAARARGWCATAPRFNNCVEGAYGIARFAQREAVESDEHARSTCGVRELRRPPVRRSEGQRAAAARRPTSIVCWWRSFVGGERAMLAAPRIGAARRRALRRSRPAAPAGRRFAHFVLDLFRAGPLRSSGRPTRHSPPPDIRAGHCAAAGDNTPLAATRRHTATSVSSLDGGC